MPKDKLDTSHRDSLEKQFYTDFGLLMKKRRTESCLTIERLAAFLDCTRLTVSNMEEGKFNCSFHLGLKAARLLKIDIDSLMTSATAEIASLLQSNEKNLYSKGE